MATPLLSIQDLHARIEGKDILKGLSLDIRPGEVHAIMGPNGAGKAPWPPCSAAASSTR